MKYNFDEVVDRLGSDCLKWEKQNKFGQATGLIPFWIADTDFATLPDAVAAMQKRLQHPIFGYTFTGYRTLETVQKWYERRHDVHLDIDAFLPAHGVVTSIWFSIRKFTKPQDKIVVFTPVYDPFFAVINNQDRVQLDCPLIYKDAKYTIDWELLESQFKQGVAATIFCNPHNPVGRVWSHEEVERLVLLCKQYNVLLLSDEIHGDVALYGNKYTSAAKFVDVYNRIIVYTAISKTFNMAGLESSCCLIADKELRDGQGASMRDAWLMGPNALANSAIEACYTYGDQWVDEMNAYLSDSADYVIEYLGKYAPEITVVKPEGTYLMWLDFAKFNMSSNDIMHELASKYGVAIGSGSGYGNNAEGFMRFNIGCPRETLKKGLEKIVEFRNDKVGEK